MPRRLVHAGFLPALLIALLFTSPARGQDAASPKAGGKEPSLACVGVMGASVSAGFGTPERLALWLDRAIKAPHRIVDTSNSMFFLDPVTSGEDALEKIGAEKATSVIGLDFFFWFAYGVMSPEERTARFRKGLTLAGALQCPLVVGDLPDMSDAVGGMLVAEQVPPRGELAVLNKTLRDWAAERPNVRIVPLAAWVEALKKGTPIEVGGQTLALKEGEYMNQDKLHANAKGLALLAIKCLETLAESCPDVSRKDLVFDLQALLAAAEKPKEEAEKKQEDMPSR